MASPYNFRQKKSINYNENGKQSNPSSARKSRGRKSEESDKLAPQIISQSSRLRGVNNSSEEGENAPPETSQPPILAQSEIITLDLTENSSPIVLEDMDLSPPILTREVNNNWEEQDENSQGWSPPPELEKMEQMPFENPIANGARLYPIFEARPVVTLNELMEQRASSSPSSSEILKNSRKCPICGKQVTGFHYGVLTCQYCSIFFQQKVANIPNYACFCRRVWKHTFNFKKSCHCCRFQRCLDLGMQIPPDSMYSRISPSLEDPGMCQICGDIGTSHCKGVVTCSSCTFFFFRSTQKPFEGVCFKSCQITPLTRGNCPSCRFKKLGCPAETALSLGSEGPEQLEVEQDSNSVSVVEQLSQLFDKTCPYTEAKVTAIIPKEFGWKPKETLASPTNRISAWIYFSSLLNNELESIINFIQSIRKTLTLNDLIAMIPRHAFSLLLLWWTRALSTDGLHLSNGEFVDMETVQLLYGEKLADKMVVFAEDLKNASDKELAVIMRLVLLQPMDGDSKSFKLRVKEEYLSLRRCLLEECEVNVVELIKLIERVNGIEKMYQDEVAGFLKNNGEFFQPGNLFHSVFITKWPDFVDVGDSNGEDENVDVHE